MIANDSVFAVVPTLLAATLVGRIFRRTGVPGSMMLGGIISAACLNLLGGRVYIPSVTRLLA